MPSQELIELLRGYAALIPPKHLIFPLQLPLSDVHQFLIDSILLNEHFRSYPPSNSYQHRFWKWVIDHLECLGRREDFEVDTRIYDHYMSLLPQATVIQFTASQSDLPSQSFITYIWHHAPVQAKIDTNPYRSITLFESRTTIENGSTGMRTWSASFVLSQYLISHPDIVADKHVLELGCGVGLLGAIVASKQLSSSTSRRTERATCGSLCLTDVDERVLARCRENLQLPCNDSSLHNRITYRIVDWFHALDLAGIPRVQSILHHDIDADVILGADLAYDPSLIPGLVSTIRLALQPQQGRDKKTAFIAITLRREDTLAVFMHTAANHCLLIDDISFNLDRHTFCGMLDTAENNNVKLFKITLA